jgi:hypothetical protein
MQQVSENKNKTASRKVMITGASFFLSQVTKKNMFPAIKHLHCCEKNLFHLPNPLYTIKRAALLKAGPATIIIRFRNCQK